MRSEAVDRIPAQHLPDFKTCEENHEMRGKTIVLIPALAMLSIAAWAGYAQPQPVQIVLDDGGGYALGDMITARESDNPFEFIGCGVRAIDYGNEATLTAGFCQAQTEQGAPVVCWTDSPVLINVINSISDSAYISFHWVDQGSWDPSGNTPTCVRVSSSTQSFYLPGQPDFSDKKDK